MKGFLLNDAVQCMHKHHYHLDKRFTHLFPLYSTLFLFVSLSFFAKKRKLNFNLRYLKSKEKNETILQ